MSSRAQLSPQAIQHAREDRNGWLFALATVAVSCGVILFGLASAQPWH